MTVEIQKIESEHDGSARVEFFAPSAERLLKLAEFRTAVRVEYDGLAVKDGGTHPEAFGVSRDRGKPMRPIVAATRDNADVAVVEMDSDAIAVAFDLVYPIRADW